MSQQQEQIRTAGLAIVKRLAPEIDPAKIIPDKPLRTQIDLDSMDWLNFLVSLHERFGITIPEADYARLVSFNDVLDYLVVRC